MKRILITGVNGFIGTAAKNYFSTKYDVYGIDVAGKNDKNQFILDMNSEELQEILVKISPDIIIHAAGGANVSRSVETPKIDFDNSVQIFYNLLNCMRVTNLSSKLIFLSSAAVYGNVKKLPILEETALNPISPYGLHKKICEEIGEYYKYNYGMDICILRIFSVYGPGLRKQIMWDMFQKFLRKGKIELFGTGEETRDFIYITDLLRSIEYIIDTHEKYGVYNIANGEDITIREMAEIFSRVMCGENRVSFNNIVREGDPRFWCADISKIKKLGYLMETKLGDGITNYINWAKSECQKIKERES